MLPERRHAADRAFMIEVREAPLHSLRDIGTRFMYKLSDVRQDRLRKVSGFVDVGVDSGIECWHGSETPMDLSVGIILVFYLMEKPEVGSKK